MNTSTAFTGSIPENYDKYLGPLLFNFPSKDFADRVRKIVGDKGEVLEVAAGTGISTEFLRNALPKEVSILATDISEDMLKFARSKRGDLPNVSYAVADALALPFEDNRFDVVACQFGVMFFPDKKKGLEEMLRVCMPGGTVLFNVWDTLEHNPIIKLAGNVAAGFFESDPPKFLQIPFGYNNIAEITELMQSIGLIEVSSEVVSAVIDGNTSESIARGVITGNPMIVEIQARGTASPEIVVEKVKEAIEHEYGSEPKVPLQKIVFWGTKPE
ncbi:MAG: methyltransferase domain-containing protein [Candidatus Kaiserbacteria bacterium]|nr:methyltransferase domain-containing protein [Candidatus Kaiserbacteria bacterium]